MIHLIESEQPQQLYILPRIYSNNVIVTLRNDSTNKLQTINNIDALIDKNYLTFSAIFELKKDNFYDLKVFDSIDNTIIYRDKIFCTNQEINQLENKYYSINKGDYKEKDANNDFIIL